MAERERRLNPPWGGTYVPRTSVMDSDEMKRAVRRMAHEIIERNPDSADVVLIGLQTGGVTLAGRISQVLGEIDGLEPDLGTLDVAFYRDDIGLRPVLPQEVTDINMPLDGRVVILVDDVLFTGRTIRAAMDAISDYGRPRAIQLAVMIDRGHRELPIRPDYVGKNIPTARAEVVDVTEDGVTLGEVQNK